MEQNLSMYDLVRIDHFRGFVGFWEVPADEETAVNGQWREAPCRDFLNALLRRFPTLPVVAEDLGEITPDVREMISLFELPGMKVLLFAFGEDDPRNPFLPHNYPRNCVAYTGTHDTNTVRGWFENEVDGEMRERIFRYMGRSPGADELPWEMLRLGMGSVADLMIAPLQDVLGLPEAARMNTPGTAQGNWRWRVVPEELDPLLTRRLAELTRTYGRT
jgi:4-alpha-glucanotransferase